MDKSTKVAQGGFVTVDAEGLIQHWNLSTNKCVHSIKEESGSYLNALDYSPDGRMFAVGGSDTHVYLYDESTR
jgi:WD40 repeat protein